MAFSGDHPLGPYQLEAKLGPGSLGEVWRAEDPRSRETVAIRVLPAEASGKRAELKKALGPRSPLRRLRHPCLAGVRDLVVTKEHVAVVTDYVDGGPLTVVLREAPLTIEASGRLAADVLAALAAVHGAGIVHGSVRPANVLLASWWQRLTPGAARLTDLPVPGFAESRPVGRLAPEHVAPEHLDGGSSTPGDVYGVGVMLYQMLSGRSPYPSRASRTANATPPVLDLPARLWNVLSAMLAGDATRRPTAAEASESLERLTATFEGVPVVKAAWRSGNPPPAPAEAVDPADDPYLTRPAAPLGAPQGHTMVRPGSAVPVADDEAPTPVAPVAWYRRPWLWIGLAVVVLVATLLAVYLLVPR